MGVDDGQSRAPQTIEVASVLSFLIVVLTAAAYLAGYVYARAWFEFFGIEPTTLQVPTEAVLVYGFLVLRSQLAEFALLFALLVAIFYLAWIYHLDFSRFGLIMTIGLVMLLFSAFKYAERAAEQAFDEQATQIPKYANGEWVRKDRGETLSFVAVALLPSQSPADPQIAERLLAGCFVLVTSSPTDVFLAEFKIGRVEPTVSPLRTVLRLPTSQVRWIVYERSSPNNINVCKS